MTMWQPDIDNRQGPAYVAIADAIADAIASGDLRPGDRLPPQRELAWRLGVTTGTVGRAYMLAGGKGLVGGTVGRGTFVSQRSTRKTPPPSADMLAPIASPLALDMRRNGPVMGPHGEALSDALRAIAARSDNTTLLRYMPAAGHPSHRADGARFVARVGLQVSPDNVVLTSGAQDGIAATLAALLRPGERIVTHSLMYPGFIDAANLLGIGVAGIAEDDDGPTPDGVERAAVDSGARTVFLTPTIHNPTTMVMPEQRRRDIVAVARRLDLTIIEDDVYGFLPTSRPLPIAALAPERTVFIASTSKCLAPGLRLGWLAAPEPLVRRLVDANYRLKLAQPPLMAEIARHWFATGIADDLIDWQRAELAERHRIADAALADLPISSHSAAVNVFLHLPDSWPAQSFVAAAETRGIGLLAAGEFAVPGYSSPEAVRISLSAGTHQELRAALNSLAEMAVTQLPPSRAII